MSCLIVGCGYLGRRVARLLIERGEIVFGTTRSRADELTALGIRPIVADVLVPETLGTIPNVDRVLHCVGYDMALIHTMRAVYVDGLKNLLEALEGAPKLVLASSTGVYGSLVAGKLDEDSPIYPAVRTQKHLAEAERLLGARGVIVRYSGLYGPGRILRSEAVTRGEPFDDSPDGLVNLIHIDDAAEAAVLALDRGVPGRLYLATCDEPVSRRVLYGLTARLLGAPEPVFVKPDYIGREDLDRWFSNRRIKEELGLALRYPTIATGLPASIADQSAGAGSM